MKKMVQVTAGRGTNFYLSVYFIHYTSTLCIDLNSCQAKTIVHILCLNVLCCADMYHIYLYFITTTELQTSKCAQIAKFFSRQLVSILVYNAADAQSRLWL